MRAASDFQVSRSRCAPVILACACLLLGFLPQAAAKSIPRPHRQPKGIVHTIQHLEAQWRLAQLKGDTATMANMLSSDYLGIYSDGTLATRNETLAAVRSGALHFTEMNVSDVKIRVFGTTVVVVSKAQVQGSKDGESIDGSYRYTRVYHRINGAWKIVSFEASSLRHHRHHPHPAHNPS
jgi:ketosteroid isomerase-like protein